MSDYWQRKLKACQDYYEAELERVTQRVEELEDALAKARGGKHFLCLWCHRPMKTTFDRVRDLATAQEHMLQCPKHPLTEVTRERDLLLAEVALARGATADQVRNVVLKSPDPSKPLEVSVQLPSGGGLDLGGRYSTRKGGDSRP